MRKINFRAWEVHLQVTLTFLIVLFSYGCQPKLEDLDQYKRPGWLNGSLMKQIGAQENLSLFKKCVEGTVYDSIIDKSGSYTIFAPDNDALTAFLKEKNYSSVDDIPKDTLLQLVESHIIQNAWSNAQIRAINTNGWIDENNQDNNSQVFVPRAFKKQTLYKEPNKKLSVRKNQYYEYTIVPPQQSNDHLIVFTSSRKYVPLFFSEYFDTYNLNYSDYQFYFNRPFSNNDMFYGPAKVTSDEIPADNGYLFTIDKVVEPMKNGAELLEAGHGSDSYQEFLNLIDEFPSFVLNTVETNKQPGAAEGKIVDNLYDLYFPGLTFNIYNEICGPDINNELNSIQYHNALFAPTDQAFEEFLSKYIRIPNGWGNIVNLPPQAKMMIVNSYMSDKPVYESDLNGFLNGADDLISIDPKDIVQKEYGSNCTFIGLKKAIVPKAFTSVSSQVYLNAGYSFIMYGIESTKVISALKSEGDYSLYAISNLDFGTDSSLFLNFSSNGYNYNFTTYDRGSERMRMISQNEMRLILLNHIGTSNPTGIGKKEFIENMAGNYLIVDNTNNTISGSSRTTFGYNGDSTIYLTPEVLGNHMDNGQAYHIKTWFSFASVGLYSILATHKTFFNLAVKAGLVDVNMYKFNFFTDGSYNTIFLPTDSALNAYRADTLSVSELKQFIEYHFVPGELIFTDGKKPDKMYGTRSSESTPTGIVQRKIHIQPAVDEIRILDKNGNVYLDIPESSQTNIMSTFDTDKTTASLYDNITTGVIHIINKVLVKDSLDIGK